MARFRPRRRSSAPVSTRRQSRLRRFRNLFPRFSPLARLRGVDVMSLFRGARRERRFSSAYLPSLAKRHSLVECLEPKQMLAVVAEFASAASSGLEDIGGNLPSLVLTGTTTGGTINLGISNFGNPNQATQGVDYTFTSTVTIPSGTYNNTPFSLAGNLSITPDNVVEPDEVIDLVLFDNSPLDDVSVGDANGGGIQSTFTYTILTDDDEFTGTAGDDDFLLRDVGGGMLEISNTAPGGSTLQFAAPAGAGGLVVIRGMGGNDRLEIDESVFDGPNGIAGDGDRSFKGKVRFFGGDGDDVVYVDSNSTSTLGIDLEIFGEGGNDTLLVPGSSSLGSRAPATSIHTRLIINGDPLDATNQSNVTFDSVIIDDSNDIDNTDTDGNGNGDTNLPFSGDNQEAILIMGSFNTLRLQNAELISDSDDIIRMENPEPTVQVFAGNNTFRFIAPNDNGELNGRAFIRNVSTAQGQQLLPVDLEENKPGNQGGGGGRLEARTSQNTPLTIDLRTDARNIVSASASNGSVSVNGDGTITYFPNVVFSGTDTITYTLSGAGAAGTQDNGRLFVVVQDVNNPPVNSLPSPFGPIAENQGNGDPVMLTLSGFPLGVTDPDAVDTVDPLTVTFEIITPGNSSPNNRAGTLTVDKTDHPNVTILDPNTLNPLGGNTFEGTRVVVRGTEAALNPFLQDNTDEVGLKYTTDAVTSGNIVLRMTTNDGGANPGPVAQEDVDEAIIIVNAINDAPINRLQGNPINNNNDEIFGIQEESGFVTLANLNGTISISDDADPNATLTTTLSVDNGTLNVAGSSTQNPDSTHSNVGTSITGDLTGAITLTGTLSQINQTLATLMYKPNSNFNGRDDLDITTNDNGNTGVGGPLSDSDTVDLVVAGDNDAPINLWNGTSFNDLNDTTPNITVNEDTDYFFNSGNNSRITISDVDASTNGNDNPITITIAVVNEGANPAHGVLRFGSTSGLGNVSPSNNSGAQTITARGTVSEINNALNDLRYTPGTNAITPVRIRITTNDNGSSGSGGAMQDIDEIQVAINPINDAPVITVQNQFPDSQTLNEDSTLVFNSVNGNMITISDVDGNTASVTLQVLGGFGKLVTAPSSAGVTGNDSSIVTINGSLSQINQALNGLQFTPSQDFYGNATLRVTANDLGNSPPPAAESTRDILLGVNPINDAPVNRFNGVSFNNLPTSGNNSFDNEVSTGQDQPFVFSGGNQISVTDVDANAPEALGNLANLLTVTLSVNNGILTLGSTAGVFDPDTMNPPVLNNASTIQLRGTLANINNALNGLTFTPSQNFAGDAFLTIVTTDHGNFGNGGTKTDPGNGPGELPAVDQVIIHVSDVNDPPSFNIAGTISLMEPDVDTIFTGTPNPSANHPITGSPQQHLAVLQDFIRNISAGNAIGTELDQNVTFNFTINDPSGIFKTGDGPDPGTPEVVAGSFDITQGSEAANDETGNLQFEIAANAFGTAIVQITATDQKLSDPNFNPLTSNPLTFLIIVSPKNDLPTITLPGPQSVMEDGVLALNASTQGKPFNAIQIFDDSSMALPPEAIDVRLGVNNGTLFLESQVGLSVTGQNTSEILINGTQQSIQAALNQGLRYTPNPNYNQSRGSERLRVEVDDFGRTGGPDFNPFDPPQSGVQDRWDARADLTISVTPKNDPVLLVNPFPNLARPEDSPAELIPLGVNQILGSNFFTDEDRNDVPPDTVTVSARVIPVGEQFSDTTNNNLLTAQVIGSNLVLTYQANQTGVAEVEVTATDLAGSVALDPLTGRKPTFLVTVGGLNDTPIITHLDRIPSDGNNDTTRDTGNDDVTQEDTPLVFTGLSAISVSDPDDASLFVTLNVQNGTLKLDNPSASLSVSGDGTNAVQVFGPIADLNNALDGLVYTPNLNFNTGAASNTNNNHDPLTITASDNSSTGQLLVEIHVDAVNDRPVANPDFDTTDEGVSKDILVLANDNAGAPNESSQTISVVGLSDAAPNTPGFQTSGGGTIVIGPNPGFGNLINYTPARTNARGQVILPNGSVMHPTDQAALESQLGHAFPPGGFYGTDTFSYVIQDNGPGNPTSTLATVTITVNPINDAPVVDAEPASLPSNSGNNPDNIQSSRNLNINEDQMVLLRDLFYINDDSAGQIEAVFTTTRAGSKVFVDGSSNDVSDAGGLTITGNNSNNVTVIGTPAAIIAAIADGDSKYTPEADFNEDVGNGDEQVRVVVRDFGGQGGGDMTSQGTINLNDRINPVADAPTLNLDPDPIRHAQVTQSTNVEIKGYLGDPNPGDEGNNPIRDPGGPDEIADQDVNITSIFVQSETADVIVDGSLSFDNNDGDLRFTINPNVVGDAVIGVNLQEVGGSSPLSNQVTFRISVGFNKEPVFNLVGNVPGNLGDGNPNNDGDIIVDEDTDVNFITNWLQNLFAGPADDFPTTQSIQSISIDVMSGANLFAFAGQPRLIDFTQPTPPGIQGGGGQPGGGDLTFTLADNAAGTAQMRITVVDNGGSQFSQDDNTAVKNFTITVTSDNDPPTFTIPNTTHTSNEDAGIQIVNSFVTNIDPGAGEGGQNVSFTITGNSNPGLFSTAPSINPGGTLTYQAAPNANGQAVVTVVAVDDGGGTNTSAPQTFAISVNAVNDAPVATVSTNPVTRNPSLPLQTVVDHLMVSPGPANESGQTITSVQVTNVSNPGLFSVLPSYTQSGTDPSKYNLSFQSAAGASGSATVTFVVTDNGGTSNGGSNSTTSSFQIVIGTPGQASVVGRHVYYRDSAYDQSPGVTDFLDDPAIDSSKTALLPGQTSSFANSTGYGRGLNGIMIDVQGLANSSVAAVTNALTFRTGTTNNTSTWTPLPAGQVQNIAVRQLNANTHRITVAFVDRAITNEWLEVRLAGGAATGLAATEVHYWGSAPGNTGADFNPSVTDVGGADLQDIAINLNFAPTNGVTVPEDLNKDRFTNAFDWQVVAANINFGALPGITPTGAAGVAGGDVAFGLSVGGDSSADAGDEAAEDAIWMDAGDEAVDGRVGDSSEGNRDMAFAAMDDSGDASMDDLLDLLADDLMS